MYVSGGNDKLSCKLFPGTLRGVAMHWMATLPARSIQMFDDLAGSFVSQFAANKVKKIEVADLFDVKQSQDETLKSYLACFNNAIVRGLRAGPFSDALTLRLFASMEEIRVRAEKHIEVEGDQAERLEVERVDTIRPVQQGGKHKRQARATDAKQHFTSLTEKRAQILREICHTSLLDFPQEVKGRVMGRSREDWCEFHRAFEHSTEGC
ncbi:hypothetical protein CR513_21037, partial [Mucuna pruriens]